MDKPSFEWENHVQALGYSRVAGIDEAGRGPLAGPLVVAACRLPPNCDVSHINDSKKLRPQDRVALFEKLMQMEGFVYAIEIISPEMIDQMNILQATLYGMHKVATRLASDLDCVLIDGNRLPKELPCPGFAVVKGDQLSFSIAAASILAKITRDKIMMSYHEMYPDYGFDQHKGYPTKMHLERLKQMGASPIHRRSYKPVQRV